MRAWLRDRFDFEWIWASGGGSGSADNASLDVVDGRPTDYAGFCH